MQWVPVKGGGVVGHESALFIGLRIPSRLFLGCSPLLGQV